MVARFGATFFSSGTDYGRDIRYLSQNGFTPHFKGGVENGEKSSFKDLCAGIFSML